MSLEVTEATPAHAAAVAELFDRAGCPCYCRWYHFEGDKNAWLERCATRVEDNRSELVAAIENGTSEGRGVVAVADGRVVGWMKIAPADEVRKLYAQRVYRGLRCFEGDRDRVFAIACFLIDETWRGKGLARTLVRRGLEVAATWGARVVEAFPRGGSDLPAPQVWTGPVAAFRDAGFDEVHAFAPYPVLRRRL